MVLSKKTIVIQSKDINSTELDDEIVMMNLQEGKYFALNSVGRSIWKNINEKVTVEQVINNIKEEYDVEDAECEHGVISFLEELKKNKLIEIYN